MNQDREGEEDHTEKSTNYYVCRQTQAKCRENSVGILKSKKKGTFSVGNFVSVKIPRINRASTDLHRVPCIVVEVLGKEYHLY